MHFLSQLFGLPAHQDLHILAAGELVVVVAVSVVVTGSPMPSHDQQGSHLLSFVHLVHAKDPPCATQYLIVLSNSHNDVDEVARCSDVCVIQPG